MFREGPPVCTLCELNRGLKPPAQRKAVAEQGSDLICFKILELSIALDPYIDIRTSGALRN